MSEKKNNHNQRSSRRDHQGGRGRRGRGRRSSRRFDTPPAGPVATPAVLAKLFVPITTAEFIVFDIETTGGNPDKNGITEIFAIRWGPQGIVDTFYSMVNPGVSIPPIVRRMTGITNAMVRDAPPITEVMPKLLEFAKDDVFVSHNTIGDMKFLRHFAQQACGVELGNFFLCTHLLIEKLAPEAPDKSLKGLAAYFKLDTGELHRAEADAYVTLALFKVLLSKLQQRAVKSIDEAVRLQGDLESGMRLGWGVEPACLTNLPTRAGVFQLFDHDRRLLFASSALQLDREVLKLASLNQLPRQLLRLVLKSYDLTVKESPSALAAMLEEWDAVCEHKINFDPSLWHQRSVPVLALVERKDGLVLDITAFVPGTKWAYGPVRDRKQLADLLSKIGQALGIGPARANLKLPQDCGELITAYFEGRLEGEREQLRLKKRSVKLWFKPAERKAIGRRLALMEKLLAIGPRPRLELLLEKSGIVVVQAGKNNHSLLYPVAAARLGTPIQIQGEASEYLRVAQHRDALVQQIRALSEGLQHTPLTLREAGYANALFWSLFFGRNDSRLIPLAELSKDLANPPA